VFLSWQDGVSLLYSTCASEDCIRLGLIACSRFGEVRVTRKTAITNHELQVALVFGVYHRLFPNFKAFVLTVATVLKRPGFRG
jgi:hypothetical protein